MDEDSAVSSELIKTVIDDYFEKEMKMKKKKALKRIELFKSIHPENPFIYFYLEFRDFLQIHQKYTDSLIVEICNHFMIHPEADYIFSSKAQIENIITTTHGCGATNFHGIKSIQIDFIDGSTKMNVFIDNSFKRQFSERKPILWENQY